MNPLRTAHGWLADSNRSREELAAATDSSEYITFPLVSLSGTVCHADNNWMEGIQQSNLVSLTSPPWIPSNV